MRRQHDTQIGWQVLTKNLARIDTVTAGKGYEWSELRKTFRAHDVRTVIIHREFDSLVNAHNARLDDVFHRRSVVECSIRLLEPRYGTR